MVVQTVQFSTVQLNSKPSFVRIHQVLGEIWLFEHKFQARNLGQL